ncbi:hypothetical protein [[Clostridium] fimetarium]|uniref:hypothetical protein n=1 Tax=[Clostridium] fimetarium TaxID=99656 RepID=UPI00147E1493|nr:hypothetical protein [[Clostridium] fimetarium]
MCIEKSNTSGHAHLYFLVIEETVISSEDIGSEKREFTDIVNWLKLWFVKV